METVERFVKEFQRSRATIPGILAVVWWILKSIMRQSADAEG